MQEKRKTRKALEMKKVLEAKLEASDERWEILSCFVLVLAIVGQEINAPLNYDCIFSQNNSTSKRSRRPQNTA